MCFRFYPAVGSADRLFLSKQVIAAAAFDTIPRSLGHAKAMVHPTLCLALDSSLFHELIYLFDRGYICYNAMGIYCNSHHDSMSWSKKT